MSKDAYYFTHDSNAKDDPKCVLLIEQLGMEGYGIYWVLVEILREQPDYCYPVDLLPAIARRYNTTAEKVKTVVFNYQLFTVKNEKVFFSQSLIERMKPLEYKRELARKAGRISADKRLNNQQLINVGSTDVQRPFNEGSTSKVKESKEKENKEKVASDFSGCSFVKDNFREVFKMWLDYKAEKKKSYKGEKSAKICYNQILKLSGENVEVARKIIERSMANNWDGLFELSKQTSPVQPEPIKKGLTTWKAG